MSAVGAPFPAADRPHGRSAAGTFGALLGLALLGATSGPALGQAPPPATGGADALSLALGGLGHDARLLVVGAHPDDEDTSLLAVLARGHGAEAAYLSLTRGEGGQNLIGPELGAGLGVLRTGELLAARQTDGARQYFTRAIDYGYSKTLEEALTFWPRDSLLKDVVRIVRRVRPQVIVSIFSGTSRDGHGQHQAAGWVTREAFRVAGDPAVFPELASEEGLSAWAPLRLFESTRFDPTATTDSLDAGLLDAVVGQSYHQIAMRSRSLHRSQDMGQLQQPGPSQVRLRLVDSRTGGQAGLFDGVDTSLVPVLGAAAAGRYRRAADGLRALGPADAARAAPLLTEAWTALEGAEAMDQRRRLARAEAVLRGLVVDFVAGSMEVTPGDTVTLEAVLWNAGPLPMPLGGEVRTASGAGWEGGAGMACRTLAPGAVRRDTLRLALAPDAPTADPYFLRHPPIGWLQDWSTAPPSVRGEPFDPPPLALAVRWCGEGPSRVLAERPVSHRRNDQELGEVRQPLRVVPRVGVRLSPGVVVWSSRRPEARPVRVALAHRGHAPLRAQVRLELPDGWSGGAPVPVALDSAGTADVVFQVRPPDGAPGGRHRIAAVVEGPGGARWTGAVEVVDYPHVTARAHTVPAEITASVVDLAPLALRRIGYVRGAADLVPEAMRAVGLPVELLDASTLTRGDLSGFDAIVIGSRAYEVDEALVRGNGRLLAYVAGGGTVVTQYQQQAFFHGGYAPAGLEAAPADTGRGRPAFPRFERVTDETAPVRLLAPDHPALTTPHVIGPADWDAWVQERGLYFAPSWSAAWTPLLEMHDPGQEPQRGALLVTRHGKGTYVYTGLSFFRELPAGVPGAWRLYLNLLALGRRAAP